MTTASALADWTLLSKPVTIPARRARIWRKRRKLAENGGTGTVAHRGSGR